MIIFVIYIVAMCYRWWSLCRFYKVLLRFKQGRGGEVIWIIMDRVFLIEKRWMTSKAPRRRTEAVKYYEDEFVLLNHWMIYDECCRTSSWKVSVQSIVDGSICEEFVKGAGSVCLVDFVTVFKSISQVVFVTDQIVLYEQIWVISVSFFFTWCKLARVIVTMIVICFVESNVDLYGNLHSITLAISGKVIDLFPS